MAAAGAPYPTYSAYLDPVSAFSLTIGLNALAMPLMRYTPLEPLVTATVRAATSCLLLVLDQELHRSQEPEPHLGHGRPSVLDRVHPPPGRTCVSGDCEERRIQHGPTNDRRNARLLSSAMARRASTRSPTTGPRTKSFCQRAAAVPGRGEKWNAWT